MTYGTVSLYVVSAFFLGVLTGFFASAFLYGSKVIRLHEENDALRARDHNADYKNSSEFLALNR